MAHQIWQSHIPGWVIRQIDEGQVFFFFFLSKLSLLSTKSGL